MKLFKNKKISYAIIILIVLLPIYFMAIDHYFSGDEVITYSMANCDTAGFVFSDGKITRYMKNEVFGGSFSDVTRNLSALAKDVVTNGRQAEILSYPRDSEVHLYTQEEMIDWQAKRPDERFDFYNTWVQSLSDDGNAWFYESLVNLISSIFVKSSSSKWMAFIVNYLFYLLSLLVLNKIGIEFGNSFEQNVVSIVGYGVWSITLKTVTNLRAYAVASLFCLLLVYYALLIQRCVADDRKVPFSYYVKFVITYAIGFVSHYTIGAALTTYGLVLVVLMLFFYKKNVTSIIATGVVALLSGIALAPDSIIGLLFEYSNKGANAMPRSMYIFILMALVPFIFCIIAIIRNKDLARDSLIYATMSTLLGLLMIMYGTNGIGYGKILFPISYFVFVSLIFKLLDRYAYKAQRGIVLCGLILFATFSIFSAYADKMSANREVEEKQIVLEANRTSTCIYFRQHARGYKDAVLLMDYFERAQTINVDTENWQDLVEYDGADSEIICYFTDESECAKAWEFVNSLGYNSIESIFDNDDTHIYMVSK